MNKNESIEVFDWQRIFHLNDVPPDYLVEIVLRTVIMFFVLIVALKFLSHRGVKQLSVFELAILIALGSATGDPMFYHNIPVTFGFVVLGIVILFYRLIITFSSKSKKMEILLEGRPTCLLEEGEIIYKNYKKIGLPHDKFYAELRIRGIDHLGQVRKAYLETSGEISLYLFEDSKIKPGLPIYPELLEKTIENIREKQDFACIYCGHIQNLKTGRNKCDNCEHIKWLLPRDNKRVV